MAVMYTIKKLLSLARLQSRLRITNDDGTPTTAFTDNYNRMQFNIETAQNNNAQLIQNIIDAVEQIGLVVKRLDDTEAAVVEIQSEQSLVNSYTDPTAVLQAATQSATSSSVTVINHARIYADKANTTVQVEGKTLTGLTPNTYYFFYYDDPTRKGGAVDIKYTTNNVIAAQTGVRHSLGGIITPDVGGGPVDGGGTTPPGGGGYNPRQPVAQQPIE